jgi:hypothetical protein
MTGRREVADDRARAILTAPDVTTEQQRKGWSAITDRALAAAGGDWETAKELSLIPLQALGAIPYPSGAVDGVKTCKQCGGEKPLAAFPQNNQTVDGRGMTCRACKGGEAPS